MEQSNDVVQVNQAFTQIDDAINQNAAQVKEAAAAAERMREEATMLAQAVGIFKLNAVRIDESGTIEDAYASAAIPEAALPHY